MFTTVLQHCPRPCEITSATVASFNFAGLFRCFRTNASWNGDKRLSALLGADRLQTPFVIMPNRHYAGSYVAGPF